MISLRVPALAAVALVLWLPARALAADVRCGDTVRRALERPTDVDQVTFAARAGEVVSISVVAAALQGPLGNVRWFLTDAGGQPIPTAAGDELCAGECESPPLPADGTYTIGVLDPDRDGDGGYHLTLEAVSATADGAANGPPSPACARVRIGLADGTRVLVRGAIAAGAIDVEGEIDSFTLLGRRGETLHVTVVRTDTAHRPPFAPEWALFDPQGVRVPTVDGATTCGADCDTQPLPRDGTYTFVVRDVGHDAPGTYDFGVAAPPATTTTTSTSTTTTLTPPLALALTVALPTQDAAGLGAAVAVRGNLLLVAGPGDGAGIVHVVDVASGASSGREVTTLGPTGAPGDRFGTAISGGADVVLVGAPGDDTAAPDAGAVWAFGGGGPVLRLTPPDAVAGAAFGSVLARIGDDALVGAPGAGRVYRLNPLTGAPLATLERADAPPGFGAAVAAEGATIVVGAPGSNAVAGAVFVLDAADTLVHRLAGPLPAPGNEFGAAIALIGTQIVVGAPGSAGGGALHVFDAATGALVHTIANPSPEDGDRFGAALAAGTAGLLVGAPGDGAGATYVVTDGAVTATLRPAAVGPGARFGASVAWLGAEMFVGAPGDRRGAGAGYVFAGGEAVAVLGRRLTGTGFGSALALAGTDVLVGAPGVGSVTRLDGNTGAILATIPAPTSGASRFGFAVGAAGTAVVAGAPGADGGSGVGAAYVFADGASAVTLQDPGALPGSQTGWALAAAGNEVAVGAPLAGARDTGTVQLFDATSGVRRATLRKPTPTAGDLFGAAVAIDGSQVLVGAPADGVAGEDAGAAYLFRRDSAVIERVLASPAPARGQLFGASVAFAGTRIAVGAPLADDGAPRAGAVYVFDRASGRHLRTLQAPVVHADDQFGHALAALGDLVLVGAPLADGARPDTGVVYLFDGATGILRQTVPDPAQGAFDHFGLALAAGPTGLLVGAPGPGHVYGFRGSSLGGIQTAAGPLCGNGLVEAAEACDDGNRDDNDDCRSDCTLQACCALDAPDSSMCDDGDPCTDDGLDPATGCRNVPSDRCCAGDASCGSGSCRACAGCFLHPWACCGAGAACMVAEPECAGTECVAGASCRCEGGLVCPGETTPTLAARLFTGACDQLRLAESVDADARGKDALAATRRRLRQARHLTRKAVQAARKSAARGAISRTCGRVLLDHLKAVKTAIPAGKRIRQCATAR